MDVYSTSVVHTHFLSQIRLANLAVVKYFSIPGTFNSHHTLSLEHNLLSDPVLSPTHLICLVTN